ncbi:ubiquitin protein ligase [Aureococcus anophagefferens]|nr:ubiquitin protein ligase [Aureococcus anophagefferens]
MSLAAARFLRGRLQPGQTDDAMDDGAPGGNDDPQLEEAFLFLAVLACLVCCCFSTCIVRRLRRLSGYGAAAAALAAGFGRPWRRPVAPRRRLRRRGAVRARGCVGAVVHALLTAPGALWSREGAAASPEARKPRRPVRLERRARGARRRPPAAPDAPRDAAPRSDGDGDAACSARSPRARARARAVRGDDDDEEEDEEDADEEAPRQTSAEAAARERAEELDRVAGLPFREKHLWLEKRLEDLRCAPSEGYVRLEIRRHCLLEDSVHQVLGLEPRSLRQWMRVQFVDEPGIDVGGIEREWFGLASEAVFDPAVGVFRQAAGDGGLVFDASAPLPAKLGGHPRELYEFAGRLLAKALVERIPVAAPLSLPLYKQLVGAPLEYDDLECLDPDLCRNLDWLLHNDGVDALDLDFSVATPRTCPFGGADPDALGDDDDDGEDRDVDAVSYVLDTNVAIRELCERGRDVKVTDRNKRTYVEALWRHHVLEAHKDATWHLAKGVYSVLPPDLLAVFDAYELELLMCGSPTIDVADWAKHTEYAGEYRRRGDRHAVIAWFWKAVAKLDDADRSKLLQFCTGSSRVPCHGFRALQRNDGKYQRFCIQSLPRNELRFPRAHTCFNRIDLPLYSSYAELEAGLKVLIAMDATGFTMD